MAAPSLSTPTISLSISVDPSSYSFADPTPPVLFITLLSHSSSPVTFFTFKTPLDPATGLNQNSFPITDLSASPPVLVLQDSVRLQRLPYSRAHGSGDDKYFLTLYPSTPMTVSAGFATGGGEGWRKPQPKHVVKKGRVVDEHGNPTSARRGTKGIGVDGLKSGKRYKVDADREKLGTVWWKWGERHNILVEPGNRNWNLSEVEKSQGVVIWQIGGGMEFEIL
ncbi:MAG: hypothetical protein Q9171_003565 [Xanthocarpia ochracea]